MKSDDNWKETRLLAEDMDTLLGLPKEITEEYLKVMENLIIHRFIEELSGEDFRGKDCSIELPYLGSLVVSIDEKNHLSLNFVVRDAFYRKLRRAYLHRESPLVDQASNLLGEELARRYLEGGDNQDG